MCGRLLSDVLIHDVLPFSSLCFIFSGAGHHEKGFHEAECSLNIANAILDNGAPFKWQHYEFELVCTLLAFFPPSLGRRFLNGDNEMEQSHHHSGLAVDIIKWRLKHG